MTAKILEPPSDAQALIRTATFRLLLAQRGPIAVEDLVGAIGIRRHKLSNHLDELDRAGRVRRDEAGQVVVPPGLRVTKDRDEVELDGRCFWTR